MKSNLIRLALIAVLANGLLSACSSTDEKTEGVLDGSSGKGSGVNTSGAGDGGISGSEFGANGSGANGYGGDSDGVFGANGAPGSAKTIYFMYDSSQVQEEFVPLIEKVAHHLQANPSHHIIIEGHADERGSREYNIALGEQRAKSVARMMTLQGAADSQIEIVSYGEEKPAADGHDESAWQMNRRAVIEAQGQ